MDAESSSRALAAANDLVELLYLAESAAERLEQDVQGSTYEQAELTANDIHRIRRQAERLRAQAYREAGGGTPVLRHPLRRATDFVAR